MSDNVREIRTPSWLNWSLIERVALITAVIGITFALIFGWQSTTVDWTTLIWVLFIHKRVRRIEGRDG